jgi:hypothetical protein
VRSRLFAVILTSALLVTVVLSRSRFLGAPVEAFTLEDSYQNPK